MNSKYTNTVQYLKYRSNKSNEITFFEQHFTYWIQSLMFPIIKISYYCSFVIANMK